MTCEATKNDLVNQVALMSACSVLLVSILSVISIECLAQSSEMCSFTSYNGIFWTKMANVDCVGGCVRISVLFQWNTMADEHVQCIHNMS